MKDLSFYEEGWNGKGVLLVHGLTGVPAEMRWVGKQLHKQGYTVYAPLLAGHGVDSLTLQRTNWRDWLESVVDAGTRIRTQVDKLYTAGICVGGKLGMLAAQQEKELFNAAAIYSPCLRYDGWNMPRSYRWLSLLPLWMAHMPGLRGRQFSESETLGIKDERRRAAMQKLSSEGVIDDFPIKSIKDMLELSQHFKRELPRMQTPTLILHARQDDVSHPRNAEYIARHIGAPHKLHWMEDSYHMIHVDKENAQVASMTAQFFEQAA